MPSKSAKQHRFMEMVAHDPKAAKRLGISQSVGKEFVAADKSKKFGVGGDVNYTYGGKQQVNKQRSRGGSTFGYQNDVPDININKYAGKKAGGAIREDLQTVNKKKTDHGQQNLFKKGGVMKTESKKEMREEMKVDTAQDKKLIKKAFSMHDKQEHKGGKGTNLTKLCGGGKAMKKMASGGLAKSSSAINGLAQKGKTKGKVC